MKRFDSTAITNNFETGKKEYELTNHLGNVMVTISDKPIKVFNSSGKLLYYKADVISAQDYYPFGMSMTGCTYTAANAGSCRYVFHWKEKDPNITSEDCDFGVRIYDARIARFLSVDPLTKKFPYYTPYQFASNRPIQAIDIDGLEGVQYLDVQTINGAPVLKRVVEVDVYVAVSRDRDSKYFYSKNPSGDDKIKENIIGHLKREFPVNKFTDDHGNDVIWKFNVQIFEVDAKGTIKTKHDELDNDNSFKTTGEDALFQYKGVIIQQQHISDEVVPAEPTESPVAEEGNFSNQFDITVNN